MSKYTTVYDVHSSTTTPGSRRLLITLYIIAVFLYWMSQYLYIPTLPVYVRSKTGNLALVGVVLAMYGLWQAIIRLPLGITVDWLGWRKPFIIVCFALSGLGAWILGVASEMNWLIIGRAIVGLAAGSWALLIVAFSSLFPPREAIRATAMLTFVASFSKMLATGVTGLLNDLGGYSLAFFLATGAALLAILAMLPVKEQRRAPQCPTVQGILKLITRRDVLFPSLLSAVAQHALWSSSYGFIPIMARQLGATDVMQSVLLSMNIAVIALGNVVTATLGKHIGVQRMVYLSFLLMSGGISAAAIASTLFPVVVAQFCTGLAWGIGYPVLMGTSIERVSDAERATAMGLHQAIYGIGMFSGPWLGGILADIMGIRPMLGTTALVCLMLGLFGTRWFSGTRGDNDSSVSGRTGNKAFPKNF